MADQTDIQLRVGTALPGATLRQLFGRMRALGHEPHPYGQEGDQRLCELIAGASAGVPFEELVDGWVQAYRQTSATSASLLEPQLELVQPATPQAPELGINKGKYRAFSTGEDVPDCDERDLIVCQYGWYYQAVQDVAAAGASVMRQFENCDLVWRWMVDRYVDDFPIPQPAELYRMLTEDRLSWMFRFNLMVFACLANGTRIVPTLFTLGGGSSLNDGQFDKGAESKAGTGYIDDATYKLAKDASPYDKGLVIPSAWGWSSFYYEEAELGSDPEAVDKEREQVQAFQQFALYVRPQGSTDDYQIEAARRKSLALAAFGLAIGEHLQLLDTVLAGWGVSITDVVPYLELGNEMSVHWLTDTTDEQLRAGALELGQMMAMLAGPAWSRCTKLRFSVPGVASWGDADPATWDTRVEWIRVAITDGVSEARAFWSLVRSRQAIASIPVLSEWDRDMAYRVFDAENPEVAAWLSTCEAADFTQWPPPLEEPLPDHGNLLHHANFHWFHANFHWFHANDREGSVSGTGEVDGGYAGEARLLDDIAVFTQKLLINTVGNSTLALSWALHPAGFPAAQPSTWAEVDSTEFSSLGDPMFQAGMVWRLLLLGKSAGAEIVSWHTHIAPIRRMSEGSNWNRYTSMGLRQDLIDGDPSDFRAVSDALRRPSWFALRRLASLLSVTTATRLWSADASLYVVRLESSAGFVSPSDSLLASATSGTRYRYAYIAWLAQDAEHETGTVRLIDTAGSGWTRISLAPRVDTSLATGVGDAGYAGGESTNWHWARGGADWTSVADIVQARTSITLTVYRASVDNRPVPVCVLTDGTLTESDVSVSVTSRLARGQSGASVFGVRSGRVVHSAPEAGGINHGLWAGLRPADAWLSSLQGDS